MSCLSIFSPRRWQFVLSRLAGLGLSALLLFISFNGDAVAARSPDNSNISATPANIGDSPNATAATLSPDQLVASVLKENPGIDALRAAADAASARIESAAALDDPMLSYLVAPNTAGAPRQGLNQNVQLSQRLPWPGTLDLRSHAATAEADSSEQQVLDLRMRLAALAKAAYAEWYYVDRAIAINAENISVVERLRGSAEAGYASGLSPQLDVLHAEVELGRLRQQALELAHRRHSAQARINTLQNRDPQTEVPSPAGLPSMTSLPAYTRLRDAAVARYPMLQSLDARVTASRDRRDLAHKNSYPQLNLVAGYNSLMNEPAKRLVVGIAINIPFGGNHRGEISEANARVREAEAKLADARNQLLGDIDQSLANANKAAETIDLYEKQLLPLARLSMQSAETGYSGGNGDFSKLISTEQQTLTMQLELERARADFFIQAASLDYQTGGALALQASSAPRQEGSP